MTAGGAASLDLFDADVTLLRGFLPRGDADRLLDEITDTTPWRQEVIKLYGRESPVPRLSAWHGDPGAVYAYSNIAMEPEPWTPPLLELKRLVDREAAVEFNSVLCNLYRSGRDSVGWHSDDEPELGPDPVIASVSLGATRTFQFRHRTNPGQRDQLELSHGGLLAHARVDTTQLEASGPEDRARPVGPRINLTYRTVLGASQPQPRT